MEVGQNTKNSPYYPSHDRYPKQSQKGFIAHYSFSAPASGEHNQGRRAEVTC
jgi:hypothetical protein